MSSRIVQALKESELFSICSVAALEQLEKVCAAKSYSSHEYVFVKGEPGDAMYLIVRGRIAVGSYSAEGRYFLLSMFEEGDIFGEVAPIDGGPRSADAVAMDETEVIVMRRSSLQAVLSDNPDVCIGMLEMLCRRVRKTTTRVEDLFVLDFPARLARCLLLVARSPADQASGRGEAIATIGCTIPQSMLASMVGASRQTVNKQLRAWDRAGIVRLSRGSIAICKLAALHEIAQLRSEESEAPELLTGT